MRFSSVRLILFGLLSFAPAAVFAAPQLTSSDFGTIGLLQTPTARMAPDGDLRVGLSVVYPYDQLLLGAQLLPWLETQLRYVQIENRLYGPEDFSGNQKYKDRGVDFKAALWDEGSFLPAASLGVMDIGGTGIFSSEYVVADKRFLDFDFDLGMGWGRLGSRGGIKNPLIYLSSGFAHRSTDSDVGTNPGGLGFSRMFHGEQVSLFGGVQWQTPIKGISLKVEYDGNNYQSEVFDNNQVVHFPLNAAVAWKLGDSIDLSAGIERGDTAMVRLSAGTNLIRNHGPSKVLDPLTTASYANQPETIASKAVERAELIDPDFAGRLKVELQRQDIYLLALSSDIKSGTITVWFSQTFARDPHRAIGRIAQTLATMAPLDYNAFTTVNVVADIETFRVTVLRRQVQELIEFHGSSEEVRQSATIAVPDENGYDNAEYQYVSGYPGFAWGMGPALRQQVGGPDGFYFGQLWWRTNATLSLSPRLSISGAVGVNIYNNFDDLKVRDTSSLPHVRSDIVQYLKDGKDNLVKLETNYIWSPAPSWTARLSGGIFEEMYGGVAAEVLYAKAYEPWAVGLDIDRVRKRDFDQRFDFLNYTVTTGDLTGYFDLPFYNMHLNLSAGRYLAGDWGGTFELSRTFSSGVVLGAFATKTNVSAAEFGEGRFDKGFFIYIPLDFFFPKSTRRGASFAFRPLTRDGGQKVRDGIPLYGVHESGEFNPDNDWSGVMQ